MEAELFHLSRLSKLNVKWVGKYAGGRELAEYEHSNPYFELIAVTEGPVYLTVEHHQMELASGDVLLLKPWERHREWRDSGRDISFFWVQFAVSPLPQCTDTRTKLNEELNIVQLKKQDLRTADAEGEDEDALIIPRRCRAVRKYELFLLFEKLLQETDRPHGYYRFRSTLLLGHILELIAEDVLDQKRMNTSVPATFITYRSLVSFLNEHYQSPITRERINRHFDHGYEYLCQVFKKYAGITIVTYIHQLRIQRAKFLLLGSNRSIQAIAEEVGFSDPYYFSKLFKRLEGQSPSQYRETKAGLAGERNDRGRHEKPNGTEWTERNES